MSGRSVSKVSCSPPSKLVFTGFDMSRMRFTTVYVNEPAPGNFHWVIHEAVEDGEWEDLLHSPHSFPTWREARGAGVLALIRWIEAEAEVRRAIGGLPNGRRL